MAHSVTSGPPAHRLSLPIADTKRWDEAKEGKTSKSPLHSNVPVRLPEADTNTMGGPPRGKINGAALGSSTSRTKGAF